MHGNSMKQIELQVKLGLTMSQHNKRVSHNLIKVDHKHQVVMAIDSRHPTTSMEE
jgi:hypothetical protein